MLNWVGRRVSTCPFPGVKWSWRGHHGNVRYWPKADIQLLSATETAERRRANISIRPAQSFFPEFDYSRRKFTHSNSGASAGFRPHFKQGVIFTEQVALRHLVSFRTRPSLGCHFQQLDERSDILFVGIHDNPPS